MPKKCWLTVLVLVSIIVAAYMLTTLMPPKNSVSKTPASSNNYLSNVTFVKVFLRQARGSYETHVDSSIIDSFCKALLLHGDIVNETHMLVDGRPYMYGVLAYAPFNRDYVFAKHLELDGVHIDSIPPLENLTLTGGFGALHWYRVSRGNTVKTIRFPEGVGVVYKDKVVCRTYNVTLKKEEVIVVRVFIVRAEHVSSVQKAGLWIVLIPKNKEQ